MKRTMVIALALFAQTGIAASPDPKAMNDLIKQSIEQLYQLTPEQSIATVYTPLATRFDPTAWKDLLSSIAKSGLYHDINNHELTIEPNIQVIRIKQPKDKAESYSAQVNYVLTAHNRRHTWHIARQMTLGMSHDPGHTGHENDWVFTSVKDCADGALVYQHAGTCPDVKIPGLMQWSVNCAT